MSQRGSQKIVKSKEFLSSTDSDSLSSDSDIPRKVVSSQKSSQRSLTQKSQNLVIDDRPKLKAKLVDNKKKNKEKRRQSSSARALSDTNSSDEDDEEDIPRKKKIGSKRAKPVSESEESDSTEKIVEKPKKKLKESVCSQNSQKTTEKNPKKTTNFDKTTYNLKLGSSGTKYVRYNNFKGTSFCDIREFYTDKKTNELKPGSKGISMKKDLVEKIFNDDMLERIDNCIEAMNTHNEIDPIDVEGTKIKVQCNNFRGKFKLVGIREFYEDKSGQMRPGKKGISLSVEQWRSLVCEKDNLFALFE